MVKNIRLLSSENTYKIISAIVLKIHNYNDIAKYSSINPKNINKSLNRLSSSKSDLYSWHFLKREYNNKNDVRYFINYRGILEFIISEILEIPFILSNGVSRNLTKEFQQYFTYVLKYYSLYQFFNSFILLSSRKKDPVDILFSTEKTHKEGILTITDSNIFESLRVLDTLNKDYRDQLKKFKGNLSFDDKFYLACYLYVQEKLIKA